MKKSNGGFTLVELLVAMAVVAILGGILAGFLVFSTNTYGKATKDAGMQENAQIVLAQIDNYVIDADATLKYYLVTAAGETETTNDIGDTTEYVAKRLEIYKQVTDGTTTEKLTWKKADKEITYQKTKTDNSGTTTVEVDEQPLASDVSAYAMDLTKMADKQQVKVQLTMETSAGDYTAAKTIHLRNQLLSSITLATGSPIVVSEVTGVRIIPESVDMRRSERKRFQAIVYGTNNPSQDVTWSFVDGAKPDSILTTIDSRGEVWIGKDETAEVFKIRATSKQDRTKYADATIGVLIPTKLTLGTIREYWTYPGYCVYVYARADGNLESDVTWEVLDSSGNPTSEGYSLDTLAGLNAACFQIENTEIAGNKDYTIKISGQVDGIMYRDKAIVHVRPKNELTSHVKISKIHFTGNNKLEYWVQPGESVNLSTIVDDDCTFEDEYKKRVWSYENSTGVICNITNKWGDYDENATIAVDSGSRTGEIWVNARIANNNGDYYYDTVTIHIYEPFKFPYIVETLNNNTLVGSNNYYGQRTTYRGPVKLAASNAEFTQLGAGIETLVSSKGGYTRVISTDPPNPAWGTAQVIEGITHITKNVTLRSDSLLTLGGIIVIEADVTEVYIAAPDIQTTSDTIIYVKGTDCNLKIGRGDTYVKFDGLIYAPEGNTTFDCKQGFVRGVVISKEIGVGRENQQENGGGMFSFLDKQSVMELVNSLKSE